MDPRSHKANTSLGHAAPSRTATTEKTYEFAGWSDGTNTYGPSDALPEITGDVTYTAVYNEYNRQYSVNAAVSPSEAGTITITGSDRYSETANISVEPAAGYHVIYAFSGNSSRETRRKSGILPFWKDPAVSFILLLF